MTDLDLAYRSAVELAEAILQKQLSPVELMSNCLDRIDAVNDKLNCFCFVYPDEAMMHAKQAEKAVMSGARLGPLHGIPVAIKDVTPTKNKTTTRGSRVYENWIPEYDALIVERLLAAGAILVGKTTTPEFAYDSFTQSPLWGVTRNPWDLERTPGGSSGGAGAAVAAGCVPLAEGSDMGGSIRIPAALCGVVGLKPSLGRIPVDIVPTVFDTITHLGPLTRTVGDSALFMNLVAGSDERDILSLTESLELPIPPETDVEGTRIALSPDLGYYALDPSVEAAVNKAAHTLVGLGADIEQVELGWTPRNQRRVDCTVGRLSRRLFRTGSGSLARAHGSQRGRAYRSWQKNGRGILQGHRGITHKAMALVVFGSGALRRSPLRHDVGARPASWILRLGIPRYA